MNKAANVPPEANSGPIEFITIPERVAVVLLCLVAASVGALVVIGRYTKSVDLVAQVVPAGGHTVVAVPRAGFVKTVWVSEGDTVKKGQPLFVVQTDSYSTKGGTREAALAVIEEKSKIDEVGLKESLRLSDQRLAQLDASERNLLAQVAHARDYARSKSAVLETRRAELARQELLMNGGYISRSIYEGKLRDMNDATADYEAGNQTVFGIMRELASVRESRIAELAARNSAEQTVRKAKADSQQEVQRAYLDSERVMVAPESGRVAGIVIRPGDRVLDGRTALMLLPVKSGVVLSAYALGKDVGSLRLGSVATIRYDPFPYQKYGVQRGLTTAIAEVPLKAAEIEMPLPSSDEYYYRVTISPSETCVRVGRDCQPLKVGMTARLRVNTDERRIIDWIFSPFYSVVDPS